MKNLLSVRVLDFSTLSEIEGARTAYDFVAILDALDSGDVAGMTDDELREMCIMSLQDIDPVKAAYVVLKHDMGDALRDGQVRNAASEMLDEKLWEEYVDPKLHERMFNAGSLLYARFHGRFPSRMRCVSDSGSRRTTRAPARS